MERSLGGDGHRCRAHPSSGRASGHAVTPRSAATFPTSTRWISFEPILRRRVCACDAARARRFLAQAYRCKRPNHPTFMLPSASADHAPRRSRRPTDAKCSAVDYADVEVAGDLRAADLDRAGRSLGMPGCREQVTAVPAGDDRTVACETRSRRGSAGNHPVAAPPRRGRRRRTGRAATCFGASSI